MYNQNILENREPIHFGHFGAIFLCAIFLVGITFMRNGFSLTPQKTLEQAPKILTYQEVYAQVAGNSDVNAVAEAADTQSREAQLALLDPSLRDGQVAGASTDADFPAVEDIFTPEAMAAQKINLQTQATTVEAVKNYSIAIANLQAEQNTFGLMAALNTDDKQVQQEAAQNAKRIFSAMEKISVPRGLEYYHKYNMFFYKTLGSMAEIFSGQRPETDMQAISEQLFSLLQKIDSMKLEIASKWGTQL